MQPPQMVSRNVLVLWRDGEWRCEFHPGYAGDGRLDVYRGEQIVTTEATLSAAVAEHRGEVLRRRLLRGDLR